MKDDALHQAERSVLGSMLRDNGVIADVAQLISTEFFREDGHRKLFAAAIDLYGAGKPVDAVTLANVLHERGQVEDVGGYGYLGELWDAAPTAANAEYYAKIVRDRAILRRLRQAGEA